MDGSRRKFLHTMGLAAGALTFAPILKGCAGVVRADLPQDMTANLNLAGLSPEAYRMLDCAALAASSHNSQPWRVRIDTAQDWTIGADTSRHLSAVDPDGRELALSIGCFMENLETAAAYFGFEIESNIASQSNLSPEMLHLKLTTCSPKGGNLKKLQLRRTLRKGYEKTPLSAAHIAALSKYATDAELLFVPADTPNAACLKEGALESFKKQSARDDVQSELARWIRFSDREARAMRDGLTPESMEINGFAGWYVRNFMKRESVMSADFRRRGNEAAAEQVESVGGWFVIAGSDSSTAELLRAGRIFQRLQCEARVLGIAVHPMSQMLEENPWRNELRANLGTSGQPQFILRCAYVKDFPAPVSLRRPVEAFTHSMI